MSKSRALLSVLALAGDSNAGRKAAASDIGHCAIRATMHGDTAVIVDTARAVSEKKTRTARAIRVACECLAAALLAQRRHEDMIEDVVKAARSILPGEESAIIFGAGAVDALTDALGAAAAAIKPGEKPGATFGAAAAAAWLGLVDAVIAALKGIDDARRAAKKTAAAPSAAADEDAAAAADEDAAADGGATGATDTTDTDTTALALAAVTAERDALALALATMTAERDELAAALAVAQATGKAVRKAPRETAIA